MTLTLPYPPSANRYWRVDRRGFTYVSTEAKAYKRAVALLCGRLKPLDGEVRLEIKVFRPRRAGDLSNRIKVLEDALRGFAFHDDDQVVEIVAWRYDDKTNPRVEVEVGLAR